MATDLMGREKPNFKEGQRVSFNFGSIQENLQGTGRIRGKITEHLIDFWIVEVDQPLGAHYPWSCISAPHSCLTTLE